MAFHITFLCIYVEQVWGEGGGSRKEEEKERGGEKNSTTSNQYHKTVKLLPWVYGNTVLWLHYKKMQEEGYVIKSFHNISHLQLWENYGTYLSGNSIY